MKCFSIIISILLTASVSLGEDAEEYSPVAECVNLVMPLYYDIGFTPLDMMEVITTECADELIYEITELGEDPENNMTLVATCMFYSATWLNGLFQIILEEWESIDSTNYL